MRKLIAMALLALAIGVGVATVAIDQSQATSGRSSGGSDCTGTKCR